MHLTSSCYLQIGAESIAGARPENEDRLTHFDSPFGYVFLLADGMGGHRGGEVASYIATSRFPEILDALPATLAPQAALTQAIQILNREILDEGRAGGAEVEGMGSTLAAVLVRDTPDGSLAIGAHVGDSRIYFLRGPQLFCLTRDHTMVERLIESGALTPEQAFDHPQASVLTRALGKLEKLQIDLTPWKLLKPGDVFLLCSDGLSGYATEDAIRQILLQEDPPDVTARHLIDLALEEHSKDNISVLMFRVAEA
jgi:serine/threonine protein phosphatase PrpC